LSVDCCCRHALQQDRRAKSRKKGTPQAQSRPFYEIAFVADFHRRSSSAA